MAPIFPPPRGIPPSVYTPSPAITRLLPPSAGGGPAPEVALKVWPSQIPPALEAVRPAVEQRVAQRMAEVRQPPPSPGPSAPKPQALRVVRSLEQTHTARKKSLLPGVDIFSIHFGPLSRHLVF